MVEPVRAYIASGRPFFGVCMGQQALLSVSEEGGEHECLGVIPGRVVRLPRGEKEEESRGVERKAQGAESKEDSKQQTAKSKDVGERKAQGAEGKEDSKQQTANSNDERANASALNGQGTRLKVPHMGWNRVRQVREHAIFEGIEDGAYFYFVHSYYPAPEDRDVVIGETEYGVTFASVLARDNIVATQFHPEKSGEAGLRMYANFLGGE
jgi:imidazoleglycerol phosphate synthase glutamine amidotransferase subunit HisH